MVAQFDTPQSTPYYPLTAEASRALRAAKLTAGEWAFWSYLVTLDPYGDSFQVITDLETVIADCEISRATAYRAMSKLQEFGLFDFRSSSVEFRNLKGSRTKNGKDRSPDSVSKMRFSSQKRENLKNENLKSEAEISNLRLDSQDCDDDIYKDHARAPERINKDQERSGEKEYLNLSLSGSGSPDRTPARETPKPVPRAQRVQSQPETGPWTGEEERERFKNWLEKKLERQEGIKSVPVYVQTILTNTENGKNTDLWKQFKGNTQSAAQEAQEQENWATDPRRAQWQAEIAQKGLVWFMYDPQTRKTDQEKARFVAWHKAQLADQERRVAA